MNICNLEITENKIYLDDVEVAQKKKNSNQFILLENIPMKYIQIINSKGINLSFTHLLKSSNLSKNNSTFYI